MTSTKRKKLLVLIIALVILTAVIFSATYAWLAGSNVIKSTVSGGSILTSYFHTGDGSADHPFVITRPLHFYNLIYLYQRLDGFYLNQREDALPNEGYYFQLGYQLLYDENAPEEERDENYYFFKYGDDGKIIPGQYTNVLNMEYYNDGEGMGGALLPIGTSNIPFLGTFDGKGLTVANLHIKASEEIENVTHGTSDVGIFGYVGETATIKDAFFSGVTIDLSDTDALVTTPASAEQPPVEPKDDPKQHDTVPHDDDKNGTPDLVYVGYLAGHIKTDSVVQNVYLNNCRVIGGDAARSGYGFFGCVEKADGTLVDSLGSEVATLRGGGDDAGFGGSINMLDMYNRLNSVWSNGSTTAPTTYVNARTLMVDEVNDYEVTVVSEGTGTMTSYTQSNIQFKFRYYEDEYAGRYFYFNRTDMASQGYGFMCLYGEGTRYPLTLTTYTYKNEFDEDGLLISVGGSYLNATISGLSAGNDADAATIWQLDNAGHLNALLEESTRFATYYLNASANGTLSLGTNAGSATTWSKTEDGNHQGTLTYTSGGRTWYLACVNGTWRGYPFDSAFSISNGANYLVQSSSTNLAGTAGNHADWHFEDGKLMTFISNTIRYLNFSAGSLSLGTNAGQATTWTKNGNVFTCTSGGRTWYLSYRNGWCCVPFLEGFTISNGANYVGTGNGSTVTSVAAANALHFVLENGNVVTYYNNTLYYLTASGGTLSLTTSVPSITWVKGADTLSYTDASSRTWYLRCLNGTWDLFPSLSSYTIHSGSNYFGVSGTNVTLTNQAGAANWVIDGTKLYTVSGGSVYYLVGSTDGSGALSLNATRANGTDWTFTQGGGTLSYTGNGETWYLYVKSGAWTVLPGSSYSLIAQNGSYLRATSTTAVDGTTEANASAWYSDGNGHLYTFYSGARRYLTASGTTVSLSNSGTTVWTRNGNGTVTDARGWYLVYDSGWKTYPALSYVLITDGTNYLTRNGNSGVTNTTTAASASRWFADGSKLYTLDDAGTKYYLAGNTTALSVTTTAGNGTAFSYDGTNKRLSYIVGSTTYYVIYNSGWKVNQNYQTSSTIKASSGNYYLNVNESTKAVETETNSANVTQWYYNSSTGQLYTEIASVKYYLRAELEENNKYGSTNLKTTTDASSATAFSFTNNNLTCTLNGTTYSLSLHNNTFKMVRCGYTYYTIRAVSSNNYFSLNGSTPQNSDQNGAVLWEFSSTSNNANTKVSTLINGTLSYLNINGSISLGNSTDLYYYRRYSSGYKYSIRRANSDKTDYLVYTGGNWTVQNANRPTAAYITRDAVSFTATALTFSAVTYETTEEPGSITATTTFTETNALNNVTFTAAANGTTQTFGNVSETVSHTLTDAADSITIDYTAKPRQHIEKTVESNQRGGYQTYFPIRIATSGETDYDANHPFKVSNKNTGYIISAANLESTGAETFQKLCGDIRISYFPITDKIDDSWSKTGLTVTKIRSGNNYLYLAKNEETETYSIANTTNANLANFWQYSDSKLFTVIGKNKFWLTYDNGLKLSETEGVNWTFSNNNRFAYNNNYIKYSGGTWTATANSANLTVTLGTLGTVYTVDGDGHHALYDEQKTDTYKQAALQLSQTLAGSDSVYGLHFMDAAISTDHLVTAPKASIFGNEYTDYELPEDSIDFNVIQRGSISFFAGEYFSGNNAFFSLHQVYRYSANDEIPAGKKVNDIRCIKEITEIYKHATSADSVNYIYKFSDNTYSNPDGTYTGAATLAEGYSNTPVFLTSWITNPTGISSNSARIYFFEIPCNAGEYCLGSVSGKTGAYLIYLDIAANGGDELASAISSTGIGDMRAFKTDFREASDLIDAPDVMDHSVLLLSYDAPAGATPETFSVSVNFDKTAAESLEDPHPYGLYTIDVLNKTGSDVTLYVYLCDDDFNMLTSFPYAYKVHYVNSTTGDGGTYLATTFGDTFQMMAGFTIPSSGEAIEVSYH